MDGGKSTFLAALKDVCPEKYEKLENFDVEGSDYEKILRTLLYPHFDDAIAEIALQESFFKFLRSLIKKLDDKQLENLLDEIFKIFVTILKQAYVDIWVFLAPSAENFHCALMEFLKFFSHLQMGREKRALPKEKHQKLLQDCQKLCDIILDALQTLSSSSSFQIRRGSRLISLCILDIFLYDKTKIPKLQQFFHETIEKSTNLAPILTLIRVMIDESSIPEEQQAEEEIFEGLKNLELLEEEKKVTQEQTSSEEICSVVAGPPESDVYSRRSTCFEDLLLFSLKLLQVSTKLHPEVDQNLDYALRQVSLSLYPTNIPRGSTIFSDLNSTLLKTYKQVDSKKLTKKTKMAYIKLLTHLMQFSPESRHFKEVFVLAYEDSESLESIAFSLHSLFQDSPPQPNESLIFPRPLLSDDELASHPSRTSEIASSSAGSLQIDPVHKIFMSDGLTASFWLALNETATQGCQNMHVFSMGVKELYLKLEILPKTGAVLIRVFNHDEVLCSSRMPRIFTKPNLWVNFIIGLSFLENELELMCLIGDRLISKTINLELELHELPIEIALGCLSEPNSTSLQKFSYEISSIFAFKGVISTQCAIVLKSLGCELNCLTECLHSEIHSSFLNCLMRRLISDGSCNFVHSDVKDSKKFLLRLQKSLMFILRASTAHSLHLSALQKGIDSERLGKIRDAVLYLTIYKDSPVDWRCRLAHKQVTSIDKCLRSIGSVKLFIFLYALAVDRYYEPEAQIEALKLLFMVLKRSPSYYAEFNKLNGSYLLVQILRSAHMNYEIFEELVNFCFSEIERQHPTVNSDISVTCRSVIIEPGFLKIFLTTPELWKNERFTYWIRFCQLVCDALVLCPSKIYQRPFREFNSSQLLHHELMSDLFHALLHMMQNREDYSTIATPTKDLSETLTKAIHSIVHELIHSSITNPSCIANLWHSLLLSHPAQDTYLDYTMRSHNDWISLETLVPGEEPSIQGHSELARFFERVLLNYGKDHVAKLWKETNSAVGVRKALYEDSQAPRVFALSTPSRLVSMACGPEDPEAGFCVQDHPLRLPQSLISVKNETAEERVEDWLVNLRADFLEIMCEILLTCPDSLMLTLESDLVYWQTIMVQLSNQGYPKIRNLIFKLLQNFLLRCSNKFRSSFINNQGFHLLANQLKKFPVSFEISNSLFSIFCGETVKIEDGLDEEHLRSIKLDSFKQASFHALFGLLEESIHESGLFWTVCSTLHKIFDVNIGMRQAMLDAGLVDVMANVLREVCVYQANYQAVIGPFFPLMDCWTSFARLIITCLVPYRSSRLYSKCEDFIWLCLLSDWQHNNPELELDDSNSLNDRGNCPECTAQLLRKALCTVLHSWIECIQVVLTDQFYSSNMVPADEVKGSSSDLSDFEVIYPDSQWGSTSYYVGDDSRRRRHQLGFANHEEMARRLMFALNMTNNLFVFLPLPERECTEEEALFGCFLETLTATWKRRKNEKTADEWQTVLVVCRDNTRLLLAQLIAFVLFPVQLRLKPIDETPSEGYTWLLTRRLAVVKLLSNELTNNKQTLISLLDVNLDYQYAMKIALHELALCPNPMGLNEEFDVELDRMIKFLRSIQIESPLSNLSRDEIDSLTTDEIILLHSYYDHRQKFCVELQEQGLKLKQKEETIQKFTSEIAMALTCEIAEFQNVPRKIFIQNRKNAMNEGANANEILEHLVKELCHPEAPFFDPTSWPKGWALDTTENPRRERRRLKPTHYQFQTRFLQPHRREEVGDSRENPAQLQRLLQEAQIYCALDHVAANNHVRLNVSATLIRTVFECFGELIISDSKLHFLGEKAKSTQKGQFYAPVNYSWTYDQISEIHPRFYLLKDTSLELFTLTGDAFLVVFETTEERNSVLAQIKSMNLGHLVVDYQAQLQNVTLMWRRGSITNFDYLMTLNKLAGRSFNDLMQYPVFPFVLADYGSAIIDLASGSSYRDLSRPMAVQDKKMEQIYVHNYNSLLEENNRFKTHQNRYSSVRFGAYHYGSHYSNTGIVAHYLVRVSPYTNVALEYQDNNFDIPDRLFNSIETTWRLSSSESTTDFKELIPEFYFFPEMFQNREGLDLGIRQGGQKADNVQLPAWCPKDNYRLFTLIHRQALESPVISATLHNWIDLIFGFKQTGDAAVKAVNVFHPATYRGRDLETESQEDELSLQAVRTMVRTYGQMPLQLFFGPHLPHMNVKTFSNVGTSPENQLLPSVRGLRWGDFVGSPDYDAKTWSTPVVEFNFESNERSGHLYALNCEGGGPCYGLPEQTHLLVKYKPDKRDPLRRNIDILNMALLSWRFSDNVLRVKLIKMDDSVWINLIDLQPFEVSKIAYSPNNDLLFIGLVCGLIRVYSLVFIQETRTWLVNLKSEFLGHNCAISVLKLSDEHHVLVSASIDAKICLWDINRLTYIRTLKIPSSGQESPSETVTLIAISSINSDIAIVLQSGQGSRVVLYTVNGDIIDVHKDDLTITSMVMTNLDEGTAINCLVIGLETGVIKLIEAWTMTVIREIQCSEYREPVISVEFGNDSKRLFAALASGRVLCWQVPNFFGSGKSKSPSFKMLNPFV